MRQPIRIVLTRSHAWLPELHPDETLSSWLTRAGRAAVRSYSFGVGLGVDQDYGELELTGFSGVPKLSSQLRAAALRPAGLLRPSLARTVYCGGCLSEDWAAGREPYFRRAWTLGWAATCSRHGPLQDERWQGKWQLKNFIGEPCWAKGRYVCIDVSGPRRRNEILRVFIGAEPRGSYIEHALNELSPTRCRWWPEGYSPQGFRRLWRRLVVRLMGLYKGPAHRSMSSYAGLVGHEKFAINVFAEAIISAWTSTPLPEECVSHRRTQLLVLKLGWRTAPGPFYPDNYVLCGFVVKRPPALADLCEVASALLPSHRPTPVNLERAATRFGFAAAYPFIRGGNNGNTISFCDYRFVTGGAHALASSLLVLSRFGRPRDLLLGRLSRPRVPYALSLGEVCHLRALSCLLRIPDWLGTFEPVDDVDEINHVELVWRTSRF